MIWVGSKLFIERRGGGAVGRSDHSVVMSDEDLLDILRGKPKDVGENCVMVYRDYCMGGMHLTIH